MLGFLEKSEMGCEFVTAFCCLLNAFFVFTCKLTYLAYFSVKPLFAFLPYLIVSEDFSCRSTTSLKAYFQFINMCLLLLSNDSTDGEPEEKRRKVANVVINQPATDSKTLVENAQEEVWCIVLLLVGMTIQFCSRVIWDECRVPKFFSHLSIQENGMKNVIASLLLYIKKQLGF